MHPFYREQAHQRLHPGETPAEYRQRIGHRPEDPTTWGPLDTNPDATPEGVELAQPCGCRVVGNGTSPYPYTILYCRLHEAAPALLRELKRLVEVCDTTATLPDGSSPDTLGASVAIASADPAWHSAADEEE